MKQIALFLLLSLSTGLWSQTYKFGKVSKEELAEAFYPLDSSANAAILYSERKINFEYSDDEGFIIKEDHFVRMKIYNPEGYDYATKKIKTYKAEGGDKERVYNIKANTYNLENGEITKTKLAKKNIFDEELSRYYDVTKFSMPNLKPGCVVEWKYSIKNPFITTIDEIILQTSIPIKKIKARVAIPVYFAYNRNLKGHLKIPIQKTEKLRTIHNKERILEFLETIHEIEKTDVPALKEEAYSGNIDNYNSGLVYELSYTHYPNSLKKSFASNWESIVKKIYKHKSFGNQLSKKNHFEEDLNNILSSDSQDKMYVIFDFVKNKITWNEYYGYLSHDGVKKAYKEGVGNVADINLTLVSMLQEAQYEAYPVLVSTISHGIPLFPTLSGFNYVIAAVKTEDGYVLLDATDKNAVPDVLPKRALNFLGRIIRETGDSEWIELYPKKHAVSKTVINAKFTENGINGHARKTINNSALLNYRSETRSLSEEERTEWLEKEYENLEILNSRFTNLDDLTKDVIESIQFETELYYEEIGGKIYINPLLYTGIQSNPFTLEKRDFPVFFNTPWADVNTINMSIPEDYRIESIPENATFSLPNELGIYQLNIAQNGNKLQINMKMIINDPVIAPSGYPALKSFYNQIITKQKERIVLVQ